MKIRKLLLSWLLFSSALFSPTSAQTTAPTTAPPSCQSHIFSNGNTYAACLDLPVLNSFLHWNYTQSTGLLDMAFRRPGTTTSRWISWAINPSGLQMVGSQALVAYHLSNGALQTHTSSVDSLGTTLAEGALSFGVPTITATFEDDEMTILARLQLDPNTTKVNQVWQEGPMDGDQLGMHSINGDNIKSVSELDLVYAISVGGGGGGSSKQRMKNVHGILNAVSWGTMMPLGALTARYLKLFQSAGPTWFYMHVTCQTLAYIVGVAGWATGLKLGKGPSPSKAVTAHGNIGLTLFIMGTVQVFALALRPKPDHKYRVYWRAYHLLIGYAVIVLSIVNVFKGLDILNPGGGWKWAYIGFVIGLGSCAAVLEVIKWRRSLGGGQGLDDSAKSNGALGNGCEQSDVV